MTVVCGGTPESNDLDLFLQYMAGDPIHRSWLTVPLESSLVSACLYLVRNTEYLSELYYSRIFHLLRYVS